MKIKKWRELEINPKERPFKNFKIKDIVSYPYAGNDVIEAEIILECKYAQYPLHYSR